MTDEQSAAPPARGDVRAQAAQLVDGEWHRLHPASPLLHGGVGFIIVIGALISLFRDNLIALFVPRQWSAGQEEDEVAGFLLQRLPLVLLALLAVAALGVLVSWLSWRVHRFRITGDQVEVQQGIISRKQRRAPLARVQGINVRKPWFARLFGACKFEIQQAGSDANVDLNYLPASVADALRIEILHRASGREGGAEAPTASGIVQDLLRPDAEVAHLAPDSLVRISPGRIIASSLLDGFIVGALVYFTIVAVLVVGYAQYWAIFTILPAAVASLIGGTRAVSAKLRYSVAATGDGIRLSYGLASTTVELVPPGRVFALTIRQPLFWRPFGWWQVRVTRASGQSSASSGSSQSASQQVQYLLPVGDARDVQTVVGLVVPELLGSELITEGMTGEGPRLYVTSPLRARIFRWISVRRNGFAVHDAAFLLRFGRIWRSLQIVPQARVQSAALQQGPLYALWRLGRVQLHTPNAGAAIGALDQDDAALLFRHAMRTIKVAIDRDSSEAWAAALTRHTGVRVGTSGSGALPEAGRG